LPLSTIFLLDLEMLRQCGIFLLDLEMLRQCGIFLLDLEMLRQCDILFVNDGLGKYGHLFLAELWDVLYCEIIKILH
jgi:hypothetical protein